MSRRQLAGLVVSAVAVVALGVVGFTRHQQAAGELEPLATRIYQAIQLFVLEGGAVAGEVPWELQAARFAAPLVAAYVVVLALATIFREQLGLLRARHFGRHVVIAGLGTKGRVLADALLDRRELVVCVEVDAACPATRAIRAHGGLVVIGDARDGAIWRRAGLSRASHVAVVCGDDGTNAEALASLRAEAARARGSMSIACVVDIRDERLCQLLSVDEVARTDQERRIRVDFVNVTAAGIRALLHAQPPARTGDEKTASVVVAGDGPLLLPLLVGLARWAAGRLTDGHSLPATVVATDASSLRTLTGSHPEVAHYLRLHWAADLPLALADVGATVLYVCAARDARSVADALQARTLTADVPVRTVAVFARRSGLTGLLANAVPPIATFAHLDEACQPDVLLAGTTESLARALHQAYLDELGTSAVDATDPALQPWSALPETLRESNRSQAVHISVKLAAIGCAIGRLVDWDAAQRPFGEDEIELMARLEHERWVAERRQSGWRPGARDAQRRTTPYLVPWEQLSDEIREYDRLFVRRLPALLASIDMQAVRRPSGSVATDVTLSARRMAA